MISEENQTDTVSTCTSGDKSVTSVESESDVLETTREPKNSTVSYLVLGKHYFFLSFSTLTSDLYSYIYILVGAWARFLKI